MHRSWIAGLCSAALGRVREILPPHAVPLAKFVASMAAFAVAAHVSLPGAILGLFIAGAVILFWPIPKP